MKDALSLARRVVKVQPKAPLANLTIVVGETQAGSRVGR